MKRILSILTALFAIAALTSCSNIQTNNEMYIKKANLSSEEQAILDIIGSDAPYILDFEVDDTVQSLQINTYELQDNQWKLISGGGGRQFNDTNGRIALTFDNIGLGLRTSVQSKNENGSTSYKTEADFVFENLSKATSYLTDKTAIEYEKEIPLVIQIHTAKNKTVSSSPQYGFFEPQDYADLGYEKVYAITCLFSQQSVSELSEQAAK
ncbi:MAG: hypothetical protein RR048_05065 [Oscillospiraceae bacterium]